MSRPNQVIEQENEKKPLWRYFSKIRKTPHCGNYIVNGTYSLRLEVLSL